MSAPKGNQFWKMRTTHGKPPLFTPQELESACMEYIQWVEANPLIEERPFHANGVITYAKVHKMRAMTKTGLCLFLGLSDDAWDNYAEREGYIGICARVRGLIWEQKFTGAAADLLNHNIIARELGLVDKTEDVSAMPKQLVIVSPLNTDDGKKPAK